MKFPATIGLSLESLTALVGHPVVEITDVAVVHGDTVFIEVVLDTTREELLNDEQIN